MPNMIQDVTEFQQKILKLEAPKHATLVSPEFMLERFTMLVEETNEFYTTATEGDIVGAVDGLLDTVYSAIGALYQMGVPVQACWDLVHQANMKKQPAKTGRSPNDAVKPEGWVGPEAGIAAILLAQIDNDAPWD